MNRIVIVNPVWDRRDGAPEAVLARYSTLTGWASAVKHTRDVAVDVVQQFDREARLAAGAVTYHFTSRRCDRLAAALRPDVVHVNGFDRPRVLRRLRRALPHSAIAAQDHGGFDPLRLSATRRAWMRFGLESADVLLVATPPQGEAFRASRLVPPGTAIRDVMESSTSLRAPQRARRDRSPLEILWVGRLNANKDPLTVLEGFARLIATPVEARLTFVYGDDTLAPALRGRLAGNPALAANVRLVGAVAHAELPARYAASDLFVLGSHREGSGYAALEAMACGVVPVLTDIPSFRWLIGEGQRGETWRAGDPASLAEALTRVISRDVAALSRACREAFERHWSWEAIGARALTIYREFSRT